VRLKEGVTKAEISAVGIAPKSGPSVAATRPVGRVDTGSRFKHTIYIADEAAPELKRKPRGAVGCEIYVKIGEEPRGLGDCRFLKIALKTKSEVEYESADVGKQAHYILRWLMRDGSASSLSETISATITG
jgi:hypothetical protein